MSRNKKTGMHDNMLIYNAGWRGRLFLKAAGRREENSCLHGKLVAFSVAFFKKKSVPFASYCFRFAPFLYRGTGHQKTLLLLERVCIVKCARRESNPHFQLRRLTLYPLNYGREKLGIISESAVSI